MVARPPIPRWSSVVTVAPTLAGAYIERDMAPFIYALGEQPWREVALVPGAGVLDDGRPSAILEDRLEAAYALVRLGLADRVLVSGAGLGPGPDETDSMRRWLLDSGLDRGLIREDPMGHRTLATMLRARALGTASAVVCTNRFHLSRAVFLARASGLDAIGVVADRRKYRTAPRNAAREPWAQLRAIIDAAGRRLLHG